MSKWMANRTMGVQRHRPRSPPTPPSSGYSQPCAASPSTPASACREVGIFDSPTPNAFATGARRDNALVAVSTGLLARMNDQRAAGGARPRDHARLKRRHGDPRPHPGRVNTFVIVLSRIVGNIIDRAVFRSDRGQGPGLLHLRASSRSSCSACSRPSSCCGSRASASSAPISGGATLAGTDNMIAALERLKTSQEEPLPKQLEAFGIATGKVSTRNRAALHEPSAAR